MPLSRDPRMDRRKRILRENLPVEDEGASNTSVRARSRRNVEVSDEDDEPTRRRSAGYSQDVRRACQHRLVQLIPVRRRAYLTTIIASCLIPAVLLLTHYWIYVNGYLPWYGQPLAVLLDASHPRGIAAWLSGQVWLLCLASTLLTFQLRRHKLDDYTGDYRLWFWLVSTCVVGSLDSTTRVIDIFGDALNRWSLLNLGWTGPAVVQATLATLIGMLGVRLCSELKSVPTSLVFWLVGLVAWAGSAALGQELLKLEISIQFRIWLRSALWLGGLTAIWLASLSYLRVVYIEAQRRFLLRGRLAASVSSNWRERIAHSMPAMPAMPSIPQFRLRRPTEEDEPSEATKQTRSKKSKLPVQSDAAIEQPARRRFGLPSFMQRKSAQIDPASAAAQDREQPLRGESKSEQRSENRADQRADQREQTRASSSASGGPLSQARRADPSTTNSQRTATNASTGNATATSSTVTSSANSNRADGENTDPAARPSWLGRLVGRSNKSDDAPEYRKVEKAEKAAQLAADRLAAKNEKMRLAEEKRQNKATMKANNADENDGTKRSGWLPKMSMPKVKMPSVPKPKMPKLSMPKFGLPKLKLPSLRLPPPESSSSGDTQDQKKPDKKPDIRPLPTSKPLPSTNGPAQQALENGGRPLSKAERKRLRRMQDDGDYEAEDRRAA